MVVGEESGCPLPRRRSSAVARLLTARSGDQSIARIVADLGTAESRLRRWVRQDDLDSGRRDWTRLSGDDVAVTKPSASTKDGLHRRGQMRCYPASLG